MATSRNPLRGINRPRFTVTKQNNRYLSDTCMLPHGAGAMSKAKSRKLNRKKHGPDLKQIRGCLPSTIAIFIGIIMTGGACGLCMLGYYADKYASRTFTNETGIFTVREESTYEVYKSMSFVGPVFLGVGVFTVIVSVVIICESYDKLKRAQPIEDGTSKANKKMFYDTIVQRYAKKPESSRRPSQAISVSSHKDGGNKHEDNVSILKYIGRTIKRKYSSKSEPWDYKDFHKSNTSLQNALAKIPMELFTAVPLSSTTRFDFLQELNSSPADRDINGNRTPTKEFSFNFDTKSHVSTPSEQRAISKSDQFLSTAVLGVRKLEREGQLDQVPIKTLANERLKPPVIIQSLYASQASLNSDTSRALDATSKSRETIGGPGRDLSDGEQSDQSGSKTLPPLRVGNPASRTIQVSHLPPMETRSPAISTKFSYTTENASTILKQFPAAPLNEPLYKAMSEGTDPMSLTDDMLHNFETPSKSKGLYN